MLGTHISLYEKNPKSDFYIGDPLDPRCYCRQNCSRSQLSSAAFSDDAITSDSHLRASAIVSMNLLDACSLRTLHELDNAKSNSP